MRRWLKKLFFRMVIFLTAVFAVFLIFRGIPSFFASCHSDFGGVILLVSLVKFEVFYGTYCDYIFSLCSGAGFG